MILFISFCLNVIFILIFIINYKPNDWNPIYNINYTLYCSKISGYPKWEEEHHITILYSESRNRYEIKSSDINYKSRPQYSDIIKILNQYNKK